MNDSATRVARRYMATVLRQADETDVPGGTPPDEIIATGRLVDLANLAVCLDAYMTHLEAQKQDNTRNLSRGVALLKRYFADLQTGIAQHLIPLGERADAASLRDEIRLASRTGAPALIVRYQARLFRAMFPWLKMRPAVFNGLFTGKVARAARELASIMDEESPASLLNKAALIAPVSGLTLARKWMETVAAEIGAPVKPAEAVLVDAQLGKALGEDLHQVDSQLVGAKPNTPEEADLQARRSRIVDEIQRTADGSRDPATVMAAAASARPSHQYATEIGKRLGHTPEQEVAMMARSRAVIAAGAGSGKTRVLASKVVYHIAERGADPASILATTFTTKAAAELIARVRKFGGVLDGPATDGFGTTHSICGKLLNRKATAFRRPSYYGKKEGWKQTTVLRLAVEQVKMKVPFASPPPQPKGLWEGAFAPETQTEAASDPQYLASIDSAVGYFTWAAQNWGKPWQGRPGNPKAAQWAADQVLFLRDMRAKTPSMLSAQQKAALNGLFGKARGINYRVAAEGDPTTPSPRRKQNKLEQYTFYRQPANQWFNLGRKLTRETREGTEVGIPLGEFKNALSIMKGKGLSPSEAWWNGVTEEDEEVYPPESDEAAVYAAYEWLKGSKGEPEFANTGDMDDILIDTVRALVASPTLRRQMQAQYKVILVDEAQDLNRVQHILFGLIAGYLDPATLKPWPDKHMTADTFALIGDDKQCVEVSTPISTLTGAVLAGELHEGDEVLSYRNGLPMKQVVRRIVPSQWTRGFRITTEGGHSLTMSPNHRLWATEPQTEDGQVAVYLMFRRDMGFRVGITNKGKVGSEDDYLNSYGGRCFLEKAERLWILDICPDREAALLKEAQYSLRYGIPTAVFNGEHREERIAVLFEEFGQRGARLLEERHLAFGFPHWMSQSYTKHGRERHTINLVAHSATGTQVALEWEGEKFDACLEGFGARVAPGNRRRLRRWFNNYREGLAFAEQVAQRTGANLSQRISTPEGVLREIPAAGLFVGMSVPVLEDEGLTLDPLVSIEEVEGRFVDLDVEDASNFFGGGILSHNSIYEFRGADPNEFIDKSDLVPGGDDFSTKLLDTNFRSGSAIVDAANRLIAHNEKQVPMVCKAVEDKNGTGRVIQRPEPDTEAAAMTVAEEIENLMASGEIPPHDRAEGKGGYASFGVALRSNAEAYAYGLEMLKRAIPFKSNASFFNDPNAKALIGWLTVAEQGVLGDNDLVEDALRDCVKAPYSKIGPTFFSKMEEMATGNWLAWLLQPGVARRIYSGPDMAAALEHFIDNLRIVSEMTGGAAEILNKLMLLKGLDGETMRESMVHSVEEDEDLMAELQAEAENGLVTDEMITEMAMAPVQPLLGLVKGKPDLGSAMGYVRKLRNVNNRIVTKDTEDEIDRDAVTIGTMHSWKGLEIPHMYVPFVGGKFPRLTSSPRQLASERRLAYVAITRAEQRCTMFDIPHPKLREADGQPVRSQFIGEACVPYGRDDQTLAPGKTASVRVWDDIACERLMRSASGIDFQNLPSMEGR